MIQTAEWFRNQRLNWADSRPCCEPQFWEPHILVIEMKEVYSGALIKLIMHLTPLNLWTRSMAKSAFKDVCMRSLQCPPNSCRNLVIPAESGGFQRNEVWQEGLLFSLFRCLIIPAEFGHSGLTPDVLQNVQEQNATESSCLFVHHMFVDHTWHSVKMKVRSSHQGIQQVRDCTITIQIDNCPIALKATQMGPMPVHIIALYVGPMP